MSKVQSGWYIDNDTRDIVRAVAAANGMTGSDFAEMCIWQHAQVRQVAEKNGLTQPEFKAKGQKLEL